MSFLNSSSCFALLDDARSTSTGATSRLYRELEQVIYCRSKHEWQTLWQRVEQQLQRGRHALAVLSYETGAQLQDIRAWEGQDATSQILIFKHCELLSQDEVNTFLEQASTGEMAGIKSLHASVNETQFSEAIHAIQNYLSAGDSYQVNYTYRLHFESYGSALALYLALKQRQKVPFGAVIGLEDGKSIVSLSPELFIRHSRGELFASPMKGTAPAWADEALNASTALALKNDAKNRAENLMIVDLLRNDLGRIAVTGSVKVPQLFEVTRYNAVLQMTSNISAQLRPELNLESIMSALFPCGSITGAPKRRTMQIIREIESERRGIYTGAIGWFDPPQSGEKFGAFCLSVPIRTLVLNRPDERGIHQCSMGVGAGIVMDSIAKDEYQECQLKAQFLTGLVPDFELFETIFLGEKNVCEHLDKHLARLENSAGFFGFLFEREKILAALLKVRTSLTNSAAHRLRLALTYHGEITIQCAELTPIKEPVNILFHSERCTTSALFLQHKTSHRKIYDAAWKSAEQRGAFDAIFANKHGWVTEGGRCNLFIQKNGTWYTPPLSDGVLPGVMRSILLQDYQAEEKSLSVADVVNADEIVVCNALRGALRARLM